MDQPTGHANQMPIDPNSLEKKMASRTRRIRSVKVPAMNSRIIPAPRRTPSVISLNEITK